MIQNDTRKYWVQKKATLMWNELPLCIYGNDINYQF